MSLHTRMNARTHRPDYVLILGVLLLLSIGLIMIYSISPVISSNTEHGESYFFWKQLISLTLGVGIWAYVSSRPYDRWRKWAKPLGLVAVIALLALLIPSLSITKNGATRWISLGGWVSFQPAELLKLAAIVYLAAWFESKRGQLTSVAKGVAPFALLVAGMGLVVMLFQRDLSTAGVIALSAIGMYFVAGIRWSHLTLLVVGAGAVAAAGIAAFSHRLARVTAFLNPSADLSGAGYHINQALIAIGSGGLFGVGLGRSVQVYGYLPEALNDSIFAVISEEFGLLGALIVLALLGLVIYRGFRIARHAPDMFSRLVAAGISLWILFQSVINIAAMLSLLPLTGIPLPFISYGGTNLVITLAAVGILHNISKFCQTEESYARSGFWRRHGWAHLANPGYRRRPKVAR